MSSSNYDEFHSTSSSPSTSMWDLTLSPSCSLRPHRSLSTDERETGSGNIVHDSSIGCIRAVDERRCMTQPTGTMINRLQQLHVYTDFNVTTSHGLTGRPCEVPTEEELIERLKEIINEFMTRPNHRHTYNTILRWTVDHGNEVNYSVVIHIDQPSDLF